MAHLGTSPRGSLEVRPRSFLLVIVLLVAAGLLTSISNARAQSQDFGDKPYFLVARDDMPDPTFQQTVILMVPAPPKAPIIAGVIINKPTKARLNELFTDLPHLNHPDQTVYFGGPVEYDVPLLMTRGDHGHSSTRLMNSLYATAELKEITKTISHPWSPKDCRIFFGRAQWTPDQLRGEVLRGTWDVIPANSDDVFAVNPASTWRSLVKESHEREVKFHSSLGLTLHITADVPPT